MAIDGPAGSGKSTVARIVAERLGFERLDTGAMYRAVALAALERSVDMADEEALAGLAGSLDLEIGDVVLLEGRDVTSELRSEAIEAVLPGVAAMPRVRSELVVRQRRWVAGRGGCVVEGRDIGSVVFPDAATKIFLTARPEVRAGRRQRQLAKLGSEHRGQEVAGELERRDRIDSTRAASPLRPARGSSVIDTTGLDVEAVVEALLQLVKASL